MARAIEHGIGDNETLTSFQAGVILPILHQKYELNLNADETSWNWFFSYIYMSQDRLDEVLRDARVLCDADYERDSGEVMFLVFCISSDKGNKFINGCRSRIRQLARQGGAKRVMLMRVHQDNRQPNLRKWIG